MSNRGDLSLTGESRIFLEDSISADTSTKANWAENATVSSNTAEIVNNPPSEIFNLFIHTLHNIYVIFKI